MDLVMTRGDTPTFRLPFVNEDGAPVDLTGADIRCTARRRVWAADPGDDIQWEHTIGDGITVADPPTAGIAFLDLEEIDTSGLDRPTVLSYDCQITTDSDVETVVQGRLLVQMDVSTVSP